jgi:Zn-dependent protease/CBS domain-containing protein
VSGIAIRIDYSWFVIFFLVFWILSAGYFPYYFPGHTTTNYVLSGLTATIFFFFSILLHELSHSLVAIRSGIKIPDITLFIFGGVTRLSEEAKNPRTELLISAAGPACSFVLALLFWGVRLILDGSSPAMTVAIFGYLAFINLLLGVFNLIPGFPMDGGRILRDLIWMRTGSLSRATRVASAVGKGVGVAIIFLGVVQVFRGALIGGIWFIFIGLFLRGIADRSYQELIIRQSIEGVHVREVMIHDVISVPANISVSQLVNDYFVRYCHRGFPVMEGSAVIGIINLVDIKDVAPDDRDRVTVREIMTPITADACIAPEASLAEALSHMSLASKGRLLVMHNGAMQGMLTKAGLTRFLEIRNVLRS